MKTVLPSFLISFLLTGYALCSYGEGNQLEGAEREFHQRQRNRLVATMEVSELYPDRDLRKLAEAAASGNFKEVDEILREGLGINEKGENNVSVLYWPLRNKNYNGFLKLLELGADPNNEFLYTGSVLWSCLMMTDSRYLKAALKFGGNPDFVTDRQPLLHGAIKHSPKESQLEMVEALILAGADVDSIDDLGATPVLTAAYASDVDMIYLLLKSGASPKVENDFGRSFVDELKYLNERFKSDAQKLEVLMKIDEMVGVVY
jgi:hypothetical protein